VDAASAVTSETKLSSAAEAGSSHQLGPVAASELLAQSSQHLQAGTTDPSADSAPTDTTSQHIIRFTVIIRPYQVHEMVSPIAIHDPVVSE